MNDLLKPDQAITTRTISAGDAAAKAAWTPSRILLAFGTTGPIIFLGVATLVGLLAPGYDVMTQSISDLAVGPNGWLMTAGFFVFGLSIIAFALGLYRSLSVGSRVGTLLLVIGGLSTFASGLFPTDLMGAPATDTGGIHNMLFLVIFLALIVSYIFSARALRKQAGWRVYARYTALMPVLVFGVLAVYITKGSDPGDPFFSIAGLIQRALLAVAFGWMTLTARRLLAR
jgi:hypothetical membrane protein